MSYTYHTHTIIHSEPNAIPTPSTALCCVGVSYGVFYWLAFTLGHLVDAKTTPLALDLRVRPLTAHPTQKHTPMRPLTRAAFRLPPLTASVGWLMLGFTLKGVFWLLVFWATTTMGWGAAPSPKLQPLPKAPPTSQPWVYPTLPQQANPAYQPWVAPSPALVPQVQQQGQKLKQGITTHITGETPWVRHVAIVPVSPPYQQQAYQHSDVLVAEALAYHLHLQLGDTVPISRPAQWQQGPQAQALPALQLALQADWQTYGQPSPDTLQELATLMAPAQRLLLVESQLVSPLRSTQATGFLGRVAEGWNTLWREAAPPASRLNLVARVWAYDALTQQPLGYAEMNHELYTDPLLTGVVADVTQLPMVQQQVSQAARQAVTQLQRKQWEPWLVQRPSP